MYLYVVGMLWHQNHVNFSFIIITSLNGLNLGNKSFPITPYHKFILFYLLFTFDASIRIPEGTVELNLLS